MNIFKIIICVVPFLGSISGYKIEKLIDGFDICEGLFWDADKQCLYFTANEHNIRTINKYDYLTGKHTYVRIGPEWISFIIPIKKRANQFVLTLQNKFVLIEWDGESDEVTMLKTAAEVRYHINDGKCDTAGRLWAGTQNVAENINKTQPDGQLYRLDSKLQLESQLKGIRVANGVGWNLAETKLYYIDSLKYSVDQYDYDKDSGTISPIAEELFSTLFYDLEGIPDGLAVDSVGNLLVAMHDGDRIIKISAETQNELLDEIYFSNPSDLVFGGPNLDELYVSTAKTGNVSAGIYRITETEITGLEMNKFVLQADGTA